MDLKFDIVSVAEFAPNVRMVNKFGEGRVFVAGGRLPTRRIHYQC